MLSKFQESPIVEPFNPDIKLANKTKKVILLNNGMTPNDNRVSNENINQLNFYMHENNPKAKLQPSNFSSGQKIGLASINRTSSIQFLCILATCFFNIAPPFDGSLNYSKFYWKIYIENEIIVTGMRQCIAQNSEIQAQISTVEVILFENYFQ